MEHDEEEMADVMVVLEDNPGVKPEQAIAQLVAAGMICGQFDEANGVVEGTILYSKLKSLKALPFVKYVRDVFDYMADPTPDDHEEDSEDVDDMGR